MRRRTTRMTQEQLNVKVLAEAHEFQKPVVLDLMARRWEISSVSYSPKSGARVIVLRHQGNSRSGIVVYPDGSGSRAEGKVSWNWDRVERAAEATVPAGQSAFS